MSGRSERPDRLAPGHEVSVEDIRELIGGATPHFALQIRERIARLIASLPADHPARIDGERAIEKLERLAQEGQNGPVQQGELPLPSLRLEPEGKRDAGVS